jgi:transposase-like protein
LSLPESKGHHEAKDSQGTPRRTAGRLQGPEDLTGPDGLLKQLTGALVERALGAELTEPQLMETHQRRFTGFDDKILSMYARGMSVRDIQAWSGVKG